MTSAPIALGLDLGGTKCLGVAVDATGAILDEHREPTPSTGDEVVDTLASVASSLVSRGDGDRLVAIGVGVPGLVDAAGVLRFAPNLPGVIDLPIRHRLIEALDTCGIAVPTVTVENDASCAAWGERQVGAAAGRDHVVMVTLGTGIGGGLILGGSLYRGANGFAGELGHMVVDPTGPLCPCGQQGCWERFASGSGLGRLAREAAEAGRVPRLVASAGGDPDEVRGEHVTRAAADGDADALAVMRAFARWVGIGLANLANAFDPQAFVLGGGLVEAGDILLDPVRAAFTELLDGADLRPAIEILPAALGEHAGAIGAALLALGSARP